jgi:DNA-binding winged helix-turn-helix (wHTH) protein
MRVRFDDIVFDSEAREASRGDRPLELSPKALQLLGALLCNRPRAMSRAELQDLLWPDTFVSHTSLPRLVTELRQALGDHTSDSRFIRTVHGFGYAFCGTAVAAGGAAMSEYALLWGNREFSLLEGESSIGRAPDCTVRIPSHQISRHHARIVISQATARVEDLGSKNGTFVRGRRIEAPESLGVGDEIWIGPAVLLFVGGSAVDSTRTVR